MEQEQRINIKKSSIESRIDYENMQYILRKTFERILRDNQTKKDIPKDFRNVIEMKEEAFDDFCNVIKTEQETLKKIVANIAIFFMKEKYISLEATQGIRKSPAETEIPSGRRLLHGMLEGVPDELLSDKLGEILQGLSKEELKEILTELPTETEVLDAVIYESNMYIETLYLASIKSSIEDIIKRIQLKCIDLGEVMDWPLNDEISKPVPKLFSFMKKYIKYKDPWKVILKIRALKVSKEEIFAVADLLQIIQSELNAKQKEMKEGVNIIIDNIIQKLHDPGLSDDLGLCKKLDKLKEIKKNYCSIKLREQEVKTLYDHPQYLSQKSENLCNSLENSYESIGALQYLFTVQYIYLDKRVEIFRKLVIHLLSFGEKGEPLGVLSFIGIGLSDIGIKQKVVRDKRNQVTEEYLEGLKLQLAFCDVEIEDEIARYIQDLKKSKLKQVKESKLQQKKQLKSQEEEESKLQHTKEPECKMNKQNIRTEEGVVVKSESMQELNEAMETKQSKLQQKKELKSQVVKKSKLQQKEELKFHEEQEFKLQPTKEPGYKTTKQIIESKGEVVVKSESIRDLEEFQEVRELSFENIKIDRL